MRLIFHCLVTLLTLTSFTWAQTESIPPAADLLLETPTPPASLITLPTPTDWRIVLPDTPKTTATPPAEKNLAASPSLLSLKPEPLSLAALAQGRSTSRIGLEFSIGSARPGGQLRNTNLIRTAFVLGNNVGLRPPSVPPLQLDVGVDLILDGIGSPRQQEIFPGYFRDIEDVETMLYFGPRVYLTPRDSRLQFSLGGGGAFAYYKEFLESDANDPFDFRCFSCEGRSGWGFYAMGQLRYQIATSLGVGVTAKYYRVTTSGEAFSKNLPARTKDDWLGLMLTLSIQ